MVVPSFANSSAFSFLVNNNIHKQLEAYSSSYLLLSHFGAKFR